MERNIRNLHAFWEEWQFGIGNNKATKDWTSDEKNGQGQTVKQMYCRRLKIWRILQYLVRHGMTVDAAVAHMCDVFRTDKPTPMITIIIRDQKNPNYPFIGTQRFNPRFVANP